MLAQTFRPTSMKSRRSMDNRERDLHYWVKRQPWRALLPDIYEFDVAYTSDGLYETTASHAAFLPHETIASLSEFPELFEELLAGPPNNLSEFWGHMSESAWLERHPLAPSIRAAPELMLPCSMPLTNPSGHVAPPSLCDMNAGSVS